MRTAKRILAEFMTVVMVLQACSPTVAAVAAGWQNISSEIAAASAEASDAAESGETNGDAANGSGSSDIGAAGDGAEDGAAKDDAATGDTSDSATGSDSTGDQTEGDDAAGDAAADDAEQNAGDEASEDTAAQAGATITDLNKLVELLRANGAENVELKDDGSGIRSLDVKSSEAFTILSNADVSLYYDAQIKSIITGDAKLTEAAKNGMSFQGFGGDEHPFEGRIYRSLNGADSPVELTTNRTVFNSLKLTDQKNTVKIKWVGATTYSAPMIASKVSGAENSEESKALIASVDIADPVNADVKDTTSALTAPLLGTTTGNLTANVTYSLTPTCSRKNLNANATGNIGLIANTVENGTLTLESVTFPNDLASGGTVETSSGNAGLLVGEVKDGATLSIGTLTNVPTATIQSASGSAGGVVGLVGSSTGAAVNVTEALDLHALTVKGTTASGGFIGKATDLALTVGTDNSGKDASGKSVTVKPAGAVGSASAGTYAGGLIGDASFAGEFTINSGIFDFGKGVALSVSDTSAAPSAGGLFGVLDISNGDVTVNGGSYTSTLQNGKDNGSNNGVRGNYGGLVGKLWGQKYGDNALRAFTVQNGAEVSFGVGSNGQLTYAGGLIGYLGQGNESTNVSAVVIDDATVTCATSGYASNNGKYGGAVGVVDTKNVLEVRGLKVETAGNATIGGSNGGFAGVVGSSWRGIVKFSGITDLSGAVFTENDHTAQLIYENFNSLIFAAGSGSDGSATVGDKTKWQYKRPNKPVKIDDVYSYGQVVRLGSGLSDNLITINDSHQCGFDSYLVKTGDAFALASVDDFAKLAITWQTSGYFSAVKGVTNSNFVSQVPSTNITLSADINLSGTGLTGLTKDRQAKEQAGVNENNHSFTATLNGNGHTISLAVGEPYGMRGNSEVSATSDGNGKIYRHGRLGLFAAINGATVSNVTIAGSMKFDNQSNVDAGALAGVKVGGDTSLTAVTFSTGIEYESTNKDNYVRAGGVFGSISGAGSLKIGNRKSSSVINANIVSNALERGTTCVGGAIGYIAGDCVPSAAGKTVEVDGLAISGSIAVKNGSVKTYAGGLIGQIAQGGFDGNSGAKQVTITKLDFASFSLATAGVNASNSAGLLGYSWAGTEVTLGDDSVNKIDGSYAISTTGSSVSSTKATEFGGLVYAASGHWVINDYALDLSGTILSAPNANKFGMLVCRAGSGVPSAGDSLAGLYLENRAPWVTAYKVNTDNNAITTQATTFDEWVADGCKPGSAVDDCTVNGVVSLHTKEEKLHMADSDGARNSYENRTVYGNQHQANGLVRYYYNLDRAVADIKRSGISKDKTAFITKPQELLVWSVSWYAPKALRPYVWSGEDSPLLCYGIGRIGAWDNDIQLDMTGYSYYPIDITGMNAVVRRSIIKFCFSDINKKESKNKQNSQSSQHMNMHAGLFSSYSGSNSVTIHSVTLQGSIGSASGGTGVLFTKFVKGDSKGAAKVEIKDLTLDGIKVDGAKDSTYAPLLINRLSSKTSLTVRGGYKADGKPTTGTVQGITVKPRSYEPGEKAATSLFGNLGDKNAEMVTANFQDITVPSSRTDGIFTHASLLESFAYDGTKSGSSASYIFYSKNHEKEDSSFTYCEPTYGAEIDSKGNDSEYEGQQRWYNDKKGYMTDDNLVTDGSITANEDKPQFANKYLPYVYKSKEGSGEHAHDTYHEIKVNQRVSNLLTGCGTYGDPYTLTNAAEVVTVANYINGKESAADGWQIAVIDDQKNLCTRRSDGSKGHELIYEYKRSQGSWVCITDSSKTLSNDTMHSYIQSAYYSIEPADNKTEKLNYIELDGNSFKGFGNKENPFRGVIVGDLKKGCAKATLKIVKKTRTISGLIPYSYGCVVKSLNVEYSDGGSGAAGSNVISYAKSSDGIPISFFGGIFGCILGGDNIIDGVAVNSNGFTVKGGSHLVPIGGYVGAIAGGGVIFRNMSGTSWRAGTKTKFKSAGEGGANFQLYDNPYVGRVIDGYAFSEGCSVENGDNNYKINKLESKELENKAVPCVTATAASDGTAARVTPTSAQGLLVLSAIINSGAASRGVSLAYKAGTNNTNTSYKFGNEQYGKVRNATYGHVGKPADADAGVDFNRSIADDQTAPGFEAVGLNLPYLVNNYADAATGSLCWYTGVELQLKPNEKYNLTSYGKGFTGLSGRYVSNACTSSTGINRDCIVPRIACINGNGAPITVGTKDAAYGADEYTDDDFKVSGVGGLFSTVMFTSTNVGQSVTANDGALVKDLTFSNCNVSLRYKDANGNIVSGAASNDLIGIGLLAGATANYDDNKYGIYRNVQMKNCTVSGAKSVGGLLGSSGRARRTESKDRTYMVDFRDGWGPAYLYDCLYTGLNVTGEKYVGGYVGTVASACGVWTTAAKGVNEKTVGESSTITATGVTPNVGGVLGYANLSHISVNTNIGTTTAAQSSCTAVISGVNVFAAGKNSDEYMGAGGVAGCARGGTISMRNVRVDAGGGIKSVIIGGKDGTSSGIRNVGGLFGRVTTSPYKPGKYWFEDCSVKNVSFAGVNQRSGGLVGYYHSDANIACNNITIEGATIEGSKSGGLLGMIHNGADVINVTNIKVSNTTFGGTSNGGIAGNGRGQFHLVNVLMDSNSYNAGKTQGVLLGEVDTGNGKYSLSAAGVEVKPGSGKTTSDLPPMVYTANTAAVNNKTYIAFGDYNGTAPASNENKTLYGADKTATTATKPYVTTSPVSKLAVRASDNDTTDRYLFGDGAAIATAAAIQSEVIQSKAGTSFPGRYTYTNIGGINDNGAYQNTSSYNAKSVASTFNANNDASDSKVATDFPVLVISGTDNTTVKSYLNIVTNGGFSDACRLNNENGTNPHVTAKAEVFQLKDGVFVKDDDASNNPTLRVVNNGKNNMSFSPSSDWDNGKGRFTLLTVTFTEAGQSYNVQVPIVVKRKLEIDFTATYDYGTNFKESDYKNLGKDAHVLTSFGEPMTGLLTWTYNSANGKEVDFGWDSYMAAGGSMKGLGKRILFNGADGRLPQGTQLTLIDANVDGKAGGREYHYTVGEGGATSVSLSGNDGFEDSARNPYQERWLSEILDVRAAQDGPGTWTVCENEAEATAKAKFKGEWTLFKVAGADVPSKDRYTLKVPKEDTKVPKEDTGKEQRASESVYLVVNVPKSGDGATQASINGFTASSIDSNSSGGRISCNLHHVLRTGGEDIQNGTASTYSILSNYGQSVVDNKNEARIPVSKSEDGAAYVLSLDVRDTVTFSPSQYYTDSDHLFYQLDTSLCRYGANNNLMGVSSFPSGTSAIAKFYVATGGQNYRWNGGDWEPCDASTPAFTQTVTDTGDDSLKLALDHDLAGIRKIATDGSFTVHTVVEEIRLTPDGCNKVISLSKQSGEDACTKMSYTAKLSTRKEGLNTSSLTQTKPGNVGYYRMDTGDTTITLSAPDKSQLGINVDDLRPIANGTIGLGATYELGGLNAAAETIKNADSVVYTLTLQRRVGNKGSYENVTGNISEYVTVTESKLATVNAAGSAITFTDSTKENGKFRTQNGDTTFNLPFTVKVNTQAEQRDQFYANYRLVMTASLVTGSTVSATPQSPDYVTYTLTRVNLNGIDH